MSSILGQFGNKGVPLGRIAGIPITLDWTWFPIAILFVVSVTTSYEPVLGTLGAILVGLAMTSGFFGSILAHEFGHALTARRFGIGTESIALHLFGGVAKITSEPRTPRQELLVAVAGPAVSLGLASLFGLLTLTIPNTVGTPLSLLAMESVFYSLGLSNLILGLFNLIPGFPLDGGRILRALVWQRKQSWSEGTRVAASWGNAVGLLMMITGGAIALLGGSLFHGLMLGMLGLIVRQSARSEALRALYRPVSRTPRVVRLPTGEVVIIHD